MTLPVVLRMLLALTASSSPGHQASYISIVKSDRIAIEQIRSAMDSHHVKFTRMSGGRNRTFFGVALGEAELWKILREPPELFDYGVNYDVQHAVKVWNWVTVEPSLLGSAASAAVLPSQVASWVWSKRKLDRVVLMRYCVNRYLDHGTPQFGYRIEAVQIGKWGPERVKAQLLGLSSEWDSARPKAVISEAPGDDEDCNVDSVRAEMLELKSRWILSQAYEDQAGLTVSAIKRMTLQDLSQRSILPQIRVTLASLSKKPVRVGNYVWFGDDYGGWVTYGQFLLEITKQGRQQWSATAWRKWLRSHYFMGYEPPPGLQRDLRRLLWRSKRRLVG